MNRPAGSVSPLRFGRRPSFSQATALPFAPGISQEVRLFAATYAAGFVLVSLLIA